MKGFLYVAICFDCREAVFMATSMFGGGHPATHDVRLIECGGKPYQVDLDTREVKSCSVLHK